jgi:hypothetical protein
MAYSEENKVKNNADQNIEAFKTKYSLGINTKYNYMNYRNEDIDMGGAKTPVFLGFSFAYKDYSIAFTIPQNYTYDRTPGKHTAFDAALSFYQKHLFEEASFKYYDDFIIGNNAFNMQFVSGNIEVGYIFNADRFSLQSAYSMNRLQKTSAGGFIVGGNMRVGTIKSEDVEVYNNRRWLVNLGPNVGYSYTFVSKNYFFLNLYLLAGLNLGMECTDKRMLFSPYIIPKAVIGKHNKTWSMNFIIELNWLAFFGEPNGYNYFNYGSATLNFVKRF